MTISGMPAAPNLPAITAGSSVVCCSSPPRGPVAGSTPRHPTRGGHHWAVERQHRDALPGTERHLADQPLPARRVTTPSCHTVETAVSSMNTSR